MKKYIKYIIMMIICLTIPITTYNAKSYIKDLFQTGENIEIDKELDGTSFLAGEKVKINKKINGIGFIASNNIEINEEQEFIFGVGSNIHINDNILKDTFLLGQTINIDNNSTIKRDAYIFVDTLTIKGNIDRNVYIYGTTININGNINGNITISAMEINIDKNAKINGTLKYNEGCKINGLNKKINSKSYKNKTNELTFKELITNTVSSYIHIAILGIVLVFICENLLKKSLKQTEKASVKKIASLCGKGLLILIGVPIIMLMLLMSGVFVSVGLIGVVIYGILIYTSNIFTAYFIASILDKKYFKKNMNNYLLIIIGLFIIYIIGLIPFIGAFISLLFMLLGLGIVGNMIIELKK